MHILLTGGAGFIGSACLVAFLRRGWKVCVIDTFESTLYAEDRKRENLSWARHHGNFDFFPVDIRDPEGLSALLDTHSFDVVVHLAAVAGVRPSITHAPLYYDINVTGTSTLMERSRRAGIEHFVLASSSSVYGGNEKTPFSEDDQVDRPVSPYAASKLAMEITVRTDWQLHGGHTTCLRFFTVYGPRQRPEMAIHKFMRLIEQEKPLPMFGDGSTGRDYTYIDDIVQGVVASVERPDGFSIYNLGGDEVIRLSHLIDTLSEVVGKEPIIERLPMQPGDVLLTNADVSRARRALDYMPQTPLDEGLEKMWRWYQSR